MRIDKFLKTTMILKRRTVANQLIKDGRVQVNDKVIKPSYEVKLEDIISITFGNRLMRVRVLSTAMPKGKTQELMYDIVETIKYEKETTQ